MSFTIPLMILNLFLAWLWLLQMPRWMSEGRTRDEEDRVVIQPILTDLDLRRTRTENKKPEEVAGKV
jgi:hypothetical protein